MKYMDKDNPPINPNDLKRIHYLSGIALGAAQQFEYGFKFLIFLLSAHDIISVSIQEAEDMVENRNKKTLGQLFKLLKQEDLKIDEGLENKIQSTIKKRNHLVHNFYMENIEIIADPKSRDQACAMLVDIFNLLIDTDRDIEGLIEQLFNLYGMVSYEDFMKDNYEKLKELNDGG